MSKCFGSLRQEVDSQGVLICANIDCKKPLKGFDISNNQRFCRRCRTKNCILRWACKGCGGIITDSDTRNTRQYCNKCNGIPGGF